MPEENDAGVASWPQLEFAALTTVSGVLASGTVIVRAREAIPAESVFPCIGRFEPLCGQSARFCPASLSPAGSDLHVDGSPSIEPARVKLCPPSGGVVAGEATTICVGSRGWAFYAYCREPPPSLTLSTAGICVSMDVKEAQLVLGFTVPLPECVKALPVIVIKRNLSPGDELLVVFNQFDGIGRLWTYPTPSPFVRVASAVPLLKLPYALDVIQKVLANQASPSITDSYVKLLEETAGLDARTTERMHVALCNLYAAVQHYLDNGTEVVALPLVMPVPAVVVNAAPVMNAAAKRPRKHPSAPLLAASFRIPQSFNPHCM